MTQEEKYQDFISRWAQESRPGNMDPCCSTEKVWNWILENFPTLESIKHDLDQSPYEKERWHLDEARMQMEIVEDELEKAEEAREKQFGM